MVFSCLEGLGQTAVLWHGKRAEAAYSFSVERQSSNGLWKYTELPDESLVLNAYTGTSGGAKQLEFPEYVDGKRVTAIDGYRSGDVFFRDKTSLEKVVIPEGVTRIGDEIFNGCTSLKEVQLSSTVIRIGDYAFSGCTSLAQISLYNVCFLGDHAFSGCTGLTEMDLSGEVVSVGDYAFSGCTNLRVVTDSEKVTHYGAGVYKTCGLKQIEIKGEMQNVPKEMFSGCESLVSVNVSGSSGIENVGDKAFLGCGMLSRINLAESMGEIGKHAFENCSSLQSAGIQKINKIDVEAFKGAGLEAIELAPGEDAENGSSLISESAFENSSLQKITFHGPVNVEKLAFAGCSSLSTMENLHWMTRCESEAFQGHKWTEKDYQNGLVIKDGWLLAIDGDYDFEDLQLPDTVTSIAGRVFENNQKITGVTIPDQVKIIGDYAFSNCSLLENVDIQGEKPEIGSQAFASTGWLKKQKYAENSSLYIVNGTNLTKCDRNYIGKLVIPKEVECIDENAFYRCENITSITFEEGSRLRYIGAGAFTNCESMADIEFPEENTIQIDTKDVYAVKEAKKDGIYETLTLTNGGVFGGCHALRDLTISKGMMPVYSSPDALLHLVRYCDKLKKITIHSKSFIPYGVDAESYVADDDSLGVKIPADANIPEEIKEIVLGEEITELPADSLEIFLGSKLTITDKLSVLDGSESASSMWSRSLEGENGCISVRDTLVSVDYDEVPFSQELVFDGGSSRPYCPLKLYGIKRIAGGAFWQVDLHSGTCNVQIGSEVEYIGKDAFPAGSIIVTEQDTYAAKWAQENGYDCLTPEEMGSDFKPKLFGTTWKPSESPAGPEVTASASCLPAVEVSDSPLPAASCSPSSTVTGGSVTTSPEAPSPSPAASILPSPDVTSSADPTKEPGSITTMNPETPSPDSTASPSPDKTVSPSPDSTASPLPDKTSVPMPADSVKPETPSQDSTTSPLPDKSSVPTPADSMQPAVSESPLPRISRMPAETKAPAKRNAGNAGIQNLRVANVTVSRKGICRSGLKLTWKGGKSVQYRVYRSQKKAAGYKQLKKTGSQTYVDLSVQKGVRYYYKVQFVSGNTKIFSAPVSAMVNKKLVKPVIKLKGTKTTYVITLKKSEGTKYQFQLRMKGYNGGRWFTTERYQGKLKKKIVMKKNQGSSSDFDMRLRTRMKIKGSWKNSSWSKTIRYK